MKVKSIVWLVSALLIFGCSSAQPTPTIIEKKTNQKSSIGLECGGSKKIQCDNATFCKNLHLPENTTINDDVITNHGPLFAEICVERPQSCLELKAGRGVCGTKGNFYWSTCHANLNGEDITSITPISKECPPVEICEPPLRLR